MTAHILTLAILAGLVWLVCRYPAQVLAFCVLGVLAASCSRADTVRLAIIADADVNRPTVDSLVAAASRIYVQAGIDFEVVSYELANVPAGTNPYAVLKMLNDVERPEGSTLVWFTNRKLAIGSSEFYGFGTIGPACSKLATAAVSLTFDGTDDLTLAHELGHTIGLAHEDAYGWLMSEGQAGSRTFSPESLAKLVELRKCAQPAAVEPARAARESGGGGSMDPTVAALLSLLALAAVMSRSKS